MRGKARLKAVLWTPVTKLPPALNVFVPELPPNFSSDTRLEYRYRWAFRFALPMSVEKTGLKSVLCPHVAGPLYAYLY